MFVKEAIDPDYGLELRPEVKKELMESLQSKERILVEDVAEKLGLKWLCINLISAINITPTTFLNFIIEKLL